MGIPGERLAFAERQLRNPVGVELVLRVKIGNRTHRVWIPGVDDLPSQPSPSANARRVG